MGLMKDAFGWIVGIGKKPIDQINVDELESKLRATEHLRSAWERDIKAAEAEYRKIVSIEENAKRTPMARKLAFQKGAIVAKTIKTLTSATMMLSRISGAVGQLKTLKKFYTDLTATSALPKGLSVEETLRQIYAMSDVMSAKSRQLNDMLDSLEDTQKEVLAATGDDEGDIDKVMQELNALYDQYNEKIAMNDIAGADAIRQQIDSKQLEVNKQIGMEAIA